VRVLVVDDDPDSLEVLCVALESFSADVRGAFSAKAALEIFTEWQPDVLLSDLGMPGEAGFSLIAKIRALPRNEGGGVRAAALTAYAREEDRRSALAGGFEAHIAKPIDPRALAEEVLKLSKSEAAPADS
jgi:CheY-like chemotaxis protein